MDWLKRMNSVLSYIEDNLDGEISENKIAELSVSPKGMFQRIFAALTDITLSEYIRKRRLTQAAFDIQNTKNTNEKIIDIAVKYGYNSTNAFSSAFKKFHGATPSDARKSDIELQSFYPLSFKITLSIKGGSDMQYRMIENIENAEDLLQKIVDKEHSLKSLRSSSENNGVKSATDGMRVAVILPEGMADWDLQDAYFEAEDDTDLNQSRLELSRIFNERAENCFSLEISQKQAAALVSLLEHFDDLTNDFKNDMVGQNKKKSRGVFLNVSTMEIMKTNAAKELYEKDGERVMLFNEDYLREALHFIMCSDDDYIEIYYNGSLSALILKSSRLYAAVLPCRPQTQT
jgi:AraC-like DNA-binding protein